LATIIMLLDFFGDMTTRYSDTVELNGAKTSEMSLQSAFYSGSVVFRFASVN